MPKGHISLRLEGRFNPDSVNVSVFFCEGPPIGTLVTQMQQGVSSDVALAIDPTNARRLAAELLAAADKAEA